MAKRTSVLHVSSESVQGEGSFVEFKKFTWGERKALQQKFQEMRDADASTDERIAAVQETVIKRLAGWDWVTADGDPMPLPQTTEDFENLFDDEFDFLLDTMIAIVSGQDIDGTGKN